MNFIDAHLDLAYIAVQGHDLRVEPTGDQRCVSLPALRDAGVDLVFATIFTEPNAERAAAFSYDPDDAEAAHAAGVRQLDVYDDLERQGELTIVRTRGDLHGDTALPRIVILMEGADPIRAPGETMWWHERGVRVVGLTWAEGTRYAGGNARHGPLTAAGVDLVATLDDCGIVHDASHLADEAFDGLVAHARGPIVATHSNCRELVADDQRHLRDDQIRTIAGRGGMVGLNLFTRFLAKGRRATIDDCVRHVEHVAAIAGNRRCVGLGSDMDGGFDPTGLPVGLDHPGKLGALADALGERGWNDGDLAGFRSGNWRRLLEEGLP